VVFPKTNSIFPQKQTNLTFSLRLLKKLNKNMIFYFKICSFKNKFESFSVQKLLEQCPSKSFSMLGILNSNTFPTHFGKFDEDDSHPDDRNHPDRFRSNSSFDE
jgi:hypothetical protein